MQERPRARFPALAAALSFLFPGLGQAYAREPILAAILAAPVLVLLAAGLYFALGSTGMLRNAFLGSGFLTALLILDAALAAWRLFAILQVGVARPAGRAERRDGTAGSVVGGAAPTNAARAPATRARRRPWELAVVAVLVIATIGMHAWTGLVITTLDSTLNQIFQGPGTSGTVTDPKASNGPPSYHWDGTSRLTFLLLGIDSGPFRSEALTDTIIVLSVDPVARTAFMVSVPRDTGYLPLPDRHIYADGLYPDKVNSISTVASQNPSLWCPDLPSGADCGIRALERSVGLYLGLDINYYATVNLQGFTDLINALGGVDLCLPGVLADPGYRDASGRGAAGISLESGCHLRDGRQALAYARIRKGTLTLPDGTVEPQNDFKRAARQQDVLLALRNKFASSNWIFALPDLLKAVGRTVQTDFPRSQSGDLASLIPLISGSGVSRVVLSLPEYTTLAPNPTINYLLIPKRDVIRQKMQALLGSGTQLKGWYLGSTDRVPPG